MENTFKEFKPTSWSIDNKISIYVLAFIIAIFGIFNYNSIPKEQFPELVIPTIIVTTIYPGTSPADMENLITRPIEKNIKSISGVKKITSNSIQDFSSIVVEFNTDVKVADAKQKVKDAIDKTKRDLPNDLSKYGDPQAMDIDFSEIPIMYIELSGNIDLTNLKKYADILQDRIESFKEITRVDIIGALDREIQIDVDMYKMQAASATFSDIERAVAFENMTISSGSMDLQGMKRSISVVGEVKNIDQIKNISFNTGSGAQVKLSDIATVRDGYAEKESYARFNKENVITLNVIKKSGQNLLNASDEIKTTIKDLQKTKFPSSLNISVVGDQSKFTRNTLKDLNNTIIIGFILVAIVLMFFMGLTNAIFVGLSVPLSMAIAYIFMPWIGFTMNMLVMFSFIFALGIVVDDAIVVIENTHRIFKKTKMDIVSSAKYAAGEVFLPILSGTLTTLAPFFPLAFWPGIVGKFMFFIPVTLIITLFASLIVAYIINPVFAVDFMKPDEEEVKKNKRKIYIITGIIVFFAGIFYITGLTGIANFAAFVAVFYITYQTFGYKVLFRFQKRYIPGLLRKYEKLLRWSIAGKTPVYLMISMIVLFFVTIILTGIVKPKVLFFPNNQPNNIAVYIKTPVGTSINVTDSIAQVVEGRISKIFGPNNPYVESVITNVARGASESMFDNGTQTSNRAKINITFVEFKYRRNISTLKYMEEIREKVKGIPGTEITVDKNRMGPPTGKEINVEITSDNLEDLIASAYSFINYIDSLHISGIEGLKTDFDNGKPEIIIDVDRIRANREGIISGTIGSELRTSILGKEISKYRDGEDQFPIMLRYDQNVRKNIDRLMNMKITYRDMTTGQLRQIPLYSIAKIKYVNTYGGIKRLNLKRIITVSSNVITGYTPTEVVNQIKKAIPGYKAKDGVDIKITGEREDMKDAMSFLGKAMLLSFFLILFILITQFNSLTKPFIILIEVVFSWMGVLLGYIIFGMNISVIMTGIGIVALAGIVVRNGILLVEFTDSLIEKDIELREAIVQAGKIRITPVILTATATILGLIPLAIGFNIDFYSLLTHFNPHIYFGGENVQFFGALAWTIIFGLSFATFLTLIMIPVMYLLLIKAQVKVKQARQKVATLTNGDYKKMLSEE